MREASWMKAIIISRLMFVHYQFQSVQMLIRDVISVKRFNRNFFFIRFLLIYIFRECHNQMTVYFDCRHCYRIRHRRHHIQIL